MQINELYKLVRYDKNTEHILLDNFYKENIEFIFGEITEIDGEILAILYDKPYFNTSHWEKRYVAEVNEIGFWTLNNKQDAVDKLIEEFNLSFNFFHHNPIVKAMEYLKKQNVLIERIETWTKTNFNTIFNVIYWRVEKGHSIENIIKVIKEMIPEDENAYITKGQFCVTLIEKLK